MSENVIRTHIYTVPDLIRSHAEVMGERVRETLPEELLRGIQKVLITGCGYSYAASCQAKYIFETLAGVPAEAVFSVDASRHQNLQVMPEKTLVIGVSSSGVVARVAEALERFSLAGAVTAAFTKDPQSQCAKKARYVVDISCPDLLTELPLRGYVMTVLGFYAAAWQIALAKGRDCRAERKRFYDRLVLTADRLTDRMEQIEAQTDRFACETAGSKAHEFVGSGIEYTSAWLGKQQIIGQSGKCGVDCSLEDWLHSDFFWNEPEKIGTVLFLPSNSAALTRALEVQDYMLYLKRPVCVVTDSEKLVKEGGAPDPSSRYRRLPVKSDHRIDSGISVCRKDYGTDRRDLFQGISGSLGFCRRRARGGAKRDTDHRTGGVSWRYG